MNDDWLRWTRQLVAIAQNGLTYSTDPYDRDRYEELRSIAAEMAAMSTGAKPAYVRDLFANERGHTTPKVDVRGAVFRDDTILLVRERSDGLWTLPGGWADIGEPPSTAIEREIYEESGFYTRARRLLAVYDRDKHGHTPLPYYVYKLFFLCVPEDSIRPEPSSSTHGAAFSETIGAEFFGLNNLPPLSISRITEAQIERLYTLYCHPDWPTDFD